MRQYLKAIIAFVYAKPIKFLREVFSQKTFKKLSDLLYNPDQSDELKAFSAAFGIFMGIIPIWGLQTLAAVFLAILFKLNKPLVVLFSQVSFPPIFPLIILLSYKVGSIWMDKPGTGLYIMQLSKNLGKDLEQYVFGSVTMAVIAAIITGLLTFASLKMIKALRQYRMTAALKKTV